MQILRREAIVVVSVLLATLLLIFPVTYVVGTKTFGPYGEAGTLWTFVGSLLNELASGNLAIWFFFLSPLTSIYLLRGTIAAFRRL